MSHITDHHQTLPTDHCEAAMPADHNTPLPDNHNDRRADNDLGGLDYYYDGRDYHDGLSATDNRSLYPNDLGHYTPGILYVAPRIDHHSHAIPFDKRQHGWHTHDGAYHYH